MFVYVYIYYIIDILFFIYHILCTWYPKKTFLVKSPCFSLWLHIINLIFIPFKIPPKKKWSKSTGGPAPITRSTKRRFRGLPEVTQGRLFRAWPRAPVRRSSQTWGSQHLCIRGKVCREWAGRDLRLPSGKTNINYWKWPFYSWFTH